MFKILVTGGRKYNNARFVYETLDRVVKEFGLSDLILIHGRATGADALARSWAVLHEYQDRGYPAQWGKLPKAAGPLRNHFMLQEEDPDLVVVFPGHEGTAHMKGIAHARYLQVGKPRVITATEW